MVPIQTDTVTPSRGKQELQNEFVLDAVISMGRCLHELGYALHNFETRDPGTWRGPYFSQLGQIIRALGSMVSHEAPVLLDADTPPEQKTYLSFTLPMNETILPRTYEILIKEHLEILQRWIPGIAQRNVLTLMGIINSLFYCDTEEQFKAMLQNEYALDVVGPH